MINVSLEGTEEIFARFRRLDHALKVDAIAQLADAVYDDVYRSADAHTKTGALIGSLVKRPIDGGWEIGHDAQRAPHALFVHWGTRPHVIRPRSKKALRWAHGNSFIFSRFVQHPGYPGDAYMTRAADTAPQHFQQIINAIRL